MRKILYICLAALLLMGALPVRGQNVSIPELVDGYYQIGNAEQLKWFRDQVLAGEAKINGKLTADIKYKRQCAVGAMETDRHLSGWWKLTEVRRHF